MATAGGLVMAALFSSRPTPPDEQTSFTKTPSVSTPVPADADASPEPGVPEQAEDGTPVIEAESTDLQGGCDSAAMAAPTNPTLLADLDQIAATRGAEFSASWYQPGAGVITTGGLADQPAWSTSKVPLALAVIQSGREDTLTESIGAALRWSDNAAADDLWRALGPDDAARAQAVDDVLRQAGDDKTTVPAEQLHPPFSIFGQTQWSTQAQAGFLVQLPCLAGSTRVIADMSAVSAPQRWGLGQLPNAVFKGGWGPYASGGYLVRQVGWYSDDAGSRVPIAFAVRSSSFEAGVAVINEMSAALSSR